MNDAAGILMERIDSLQADLLAIQLALFLNSSLGPGRPTIDDILREIRRLQECAK
jgi:hypothetical protein